MTTAESSLPASAGMGRASAILAAGTVVSRVLGFVLTAVLAAAIGTFAAGDTFAIGNQLPNNIYALVAGGVLSAVLVPQIVRAAAHHDGGQQFINRVVTLGIVVFALVTVLLEACWYPIRPEPAAAASAAFSAIPESEMLSCDQIVVPGVPGHTPRDLLARTILIAVPSQ